MNELINLGNGQFVKVTMLKGEKGSNIATITKTGTSGLVDTYTVTLTDGSTTTFNVTNGSSIQSIEKTATVGLVDIYTITLTNGQTSTFEVTNGNAENLQDAFQASQCAIKAGVSQVTFTNLGDAYITYIPNSECVENAVVVVGFDNGAMYKGTMNYASAIGRWGLSNVELIQGSDVPSTWDVGYGNDSVGTRAFRTGTDFAYSNGIGIALSTSSDVVSYYCVLSSGRVSDNYLQKQINQINSDLGNGITYETVYTATGSADKTVRQLINEFSAMARQLFNSDKEVRVIVNDTYIVYPVFHDANRVSFCSLEEIGGGLIYQRVMCGTGTTTLYTEHVVGGSETDHSADASTGYIFKLEKLK